MYRWPKDDAVAQALTALHAEPTTVEVVRLVLFDEQTRHTAERVYRASEQHTEDVKEFNAAKRCT